MNEPRISLRGPRGQGKDSWIISEAVRAHEAGVKVVVICPTEERRAELIARYPDLPPRVIQAARSYADELAEVSLTAIETRMRYYDMALRTGLMTEDQVREAMFAGLTPMSDMHALLQDEVWEWPDAFHWSPED